MLIGKVKLLGLLAATLVAVWNIGALSFAETAEPSAIFYLSPNTSTPTAGSNFTVELRIKVTNDTTHSARARLTYPADKLEVTNLTPSPVFSIPAENSFGGGEINAVYGSFSSVSGDQLFASISFRAVSSATGNAVVTIDPVIDANSHSYVAGDSSGSGANILKSVSGGYYSINSTASSSLQPTASSGQISQQTTPKPPTPATSSTEQTDQTSEVKETNGAIKTVETQPSPNSQKTPLPASRFTDKTTALLALSAIILLAFLTRLLNRHFKIGTRARTWHDYSKETVADIASRINSRNRAVETVAELAARINSPDRANDTVAEISARLKTRDMRKSTRRGTKTQRRRRSK